MKKRFLILYILLFSCIFNVVANNNYEAWVNEWVELSCPAAEVPFGWDAAIIHSFKWSVSSSNTKKVTFSRNTTPTVGVTPAVLYDGKIKITVKHSFYLSRVLAGKQDLKASSETHTFYLSCKKVKVALYPNEHSMPIGETLSLQYSLSPQESNPAATISFSSDNPSVASVDFYGNVLGKAEGKATITATTNFKTSATCIVTVKPIDVIGIQFQVRSLTLNPGQTATLIPDIIPQNATYKVLSWTSSDDKIVSVDKNGIIKALEPGFAEIKATAKSGAFGCCYINVLPIDVEYISMDKAYLKLNVGETYLLTPTIYPENATNKHIDWQTKDPEVAIVNNDGIITAIGKGKTIISAIAHNGITGICNIEINDNSSLYEITDISEDDTYSTFTITGIYIGELKPKDLEKGIYLIRSQSNSTIYHKFIKR